MSPITSIGNVSGVKGLNRRFSKDYEKTIIVEGIASGTSTPSTGVDYELFFNTSTHKLMIFFLNAWHQMAICDEDGNLAIPGNYLTE